MKNIISFSVKSLSYNGILSYFGFWYFFQCSPSTVEYIPVVICVLMKPGMSTKVTPSSPTHSTPILLSSYQTIYLTDRTEMSIPNALRKVNNSKCMKCWVQLPGRARLPGPPLHMYKYLTLLIYIWAEYNYLL